jgi:polyether ionophore transport system ATP-binding protein
MTATISAQRLTKWYGHTTALDSLDLEIGQGEVFGYLGPNGAGKSTTISLLLGLIRPTSGGARIFDLDVWRDARLVHERLAYVPSEANLWPSLTGAEVLRFLGQLHGSVDAAYRDEVVRRFELVLDKRIRGCSRGLRGRRRADVAARPHAARGDHPGHGRLRCRLRRAHDRRLRLEHPLAAVVVALRLDRAHAADG